MRGLELENDVEVLRAFGIFLRDDNEKCRKEIVNLRALVAQTQGLVQLKLDY